MQDGFHKNLASSTTHRNNDIYKRSPSNTPDSRTLPLDVVPRSRSSRRKSKEQESLVVHGDRHPTGRRFCCTSASGTDPLPPPSRLFNRGSCVVSGTQRSPFIGLSHTHCSSNSLGAEPTTNGTQGSLSPESTSFPQIQHSPRPGSGSSSGGKQPQANHQVNQSPTQTHIGTPPIPVLRRRSRASVTTSTSATSVNCVSSTNTDTLTMGITATRDHQQGSQSDCTSPQDGRSSGEKEEAQGGIRSAFSSFGRRILSRNRSPLSQNGEDTPVQKCSPTDSAAANEIDDSTWEFTRPPNNQHTFFFPDDNLEFSSEFDSGNLIQVERTGPLRYNMYTSMDCGNAPCQTNNRQWFHFSMRGGTKGSVVTITMIGMLHSNMFTFNWMPVMAICPGKPQYTRLPGKAIVVPVEVMPITPGYPLLVYKPSAGRAGSGVEASADNDGDDEGGGEDYDEETPQAVAFTIPAGNGGGSGKTGGRKKKRKKKDQAMNLTFEVKIEVETPIEHVRLPGHSDCPAIYIASNHPYSYATLQRNIADWRLRVTGAARSPSSALSSPESAPLPSDRGSGGTSPPNPGLGGGGHTIYFHRETLCKTLEGRKVELLTITDTQGMQRDRMPMLSREGPGIPHSSGAAGLTQRPFRFTGKQVVVLSARVHPGECAGSHIMHGCIEFLMSPNDPRALALRQRFVFFIVPMLNPDGVVRGHSRADACGVDLNRMYSCPSPKRHPAPYCLRLLLNTYAANEKKLALFVDMHAHANKKGTFFYGNGMTAADQVQNLLYGKLVAMNTPYFEFTNCNYSESNMFAVGKSGKGKDSSSRVVLFHDTGFIHSYTIEASHVAGKFVNSLPTLSGVPGEDKEVAAASVTGVRYGPDTFGDTGKALLLALLDLKNANPVSRIPLSPYGTTKGVATWIQRQMQIEAAEKLFAQAYKEHGKVEPTDSTQTPLSAIMQTLTEDDVPDKITLRDMRSLPPTTFTGLRKFLPIELATSLLAQTPPSGLPRSVVCKARTVSPASLHNQTAPSAAASPTAAVAVVSGSVDGATPPPVIATRRARKPSQDVVVRHVVESTVKQVD